MLGIVESVTLDKNQHCVRDHWFVQAHCRRVNGDGAGVCRRVGLGSRIDVSALNRASLPFRAMLEAHGSSHNV